MPFHLPPLTLVDMGILLWLFAVGAAIGSFLNVVVYRLPLGKSLVHPASHCPSCRHPIRWYDNIPIASWLLLRGRCRDCGAPIAVRYPAVEAATALLFAAVGYLTLVGHGANLPQRAVVLEEEFAVVIYPRRSLETLVGLTAMHLFLLSTLLAAALIETSGRRPPARLFLPVLAVGAVFPLLWPELRPVPLAWPWMGSPNAAGEGVALRPTGPLGAAWQRYPGFVEGLAGLAAGAVTGWMGSTVRLRRKNRAERPSSAAARGTPSGAVRSGDLHPLAGTAAVGVVLGWQAVLMAGLAALVGRLAGAALARWWFRPALGTPSTWLLAATLLLLVFWRSIDALPTLFG